MFFVLAASLAEAQRGFAAARRWGGEVGAPPKFPNVTDFDGSWHFCRLMYRSVRSQQRGLGWGTDYPNADINFSIRLSELTKTQVGLQAARARAESPGGAARPIRSCFNARS